MEYRYQETLSWIIPGFYFLLFLSGSIILVYPESSLSKDMTNLFNSGMSDAMVALLVFAIPIFSFIVGWVLNGYAGYVFRHIMSMPIKEAYDSVNSKDEEGNEVKDYKKVEVAQAIQIFDAARRVINLENVDRFYYRYVASRNMFFAQLILTVILFFFLCNSLCSNLKISLVLIIVSLFLLDLFRNIVARDLSTHAKYVLIQYNEMVIKKSVE